MKTRKQLMIPGFIAIVVVLSLISYLFLPAWFSGSQYTLVGIIVVSAVIEFLLDEFILSR